MRSLHRSLCLNIQPIQCFDVQGFKEWSADAGDGEGDGEYEPVFKHVESIATHLSNLEKQISCPWDPSLEADLPLLKGQKYLIAANFRNNEELLPHLIVQLWHLLAILPQGSAFVSIYESGSTDSTGKAVTFRFLDEDDCHLDFDILFAFISFLIRLHMLIVCSSLPIGLRCHTVFTRAP